MFTSLCHTEPCNYVLLHQEEAGGNSSLLHLPTTRMSPRSLDLCTETLGSENGAYISAVHEVRKEEQKGEEGEEGEEGVEGEEGEEGVEGEEGEGEEGKNHVTLCAVKREQKTSLAAAAVRSSPPPLPRSILRLLPPRRSRGRLVIEAVEVQQQKMTQVHRFDGRLVITIRGEGEKKKTEMEGGTAMTIEGRRERKVNEVGQKGVRAEGGRGVSFNAYDYCWRKKSTAGTEEIEGGECQKQKQPLTKRKDEENEQQSGAVIRGSNKYVPPLPVVC